MSVVTDSWNVQRLSGSEKRNSAINRIKIARYSLLNPMHSLVIAIERERIERILKPSRKYSKYDSLWSISSSFRWTRAIFFPSFHISRYFSSAKLIKLKQTEHRHLFLQVIYDCVGVGNSRASEVPEKRSQNNFISLKRTEKYRPSCTHVSAVW